MIWEGTEEELTDFLSKLNDFGRIKYTWSYSQTHATFLDVDLNVDINGKLQTSVHIKPTNNLLYLHNTSCHPHHTKRGIVYSQAIRGKRINSTEEANKIYLEKITSALEKQGYDPNMIKKEIKRLKYYKKPDHTKRKQNKLTIPPLVTQYHPGIEKPLRQILGDAHNILASSNLTKNVFPSPATLSFKRGPNLSNIVAKKPQPENLRPKKQGPSGSFPCENKDKRGRGRNCAACPMLKKSKSVTAPNTNKSYSIRGHNTCTTEKVIYYIKCKFCDAHYIGKTINKFRDRLSGHRQSVKERKYLPIPDHAETHNKRTLESCFDATVLRAFPSDTHNATIRRMEVAYQTIFQSRAAPGLNIM